MRNHILRLICYGRYCLLVAGPTGTDGTVTDVKMNFLVAGDDHNESDDCEEGSDIFYSESRVQLWPIPVQWSSGGLTSLFLEMVVVVCEGW